MQKKKRLEFRGGAWSCLPTGGGWPGRHNQKERIFKKGNCNTVWVGEMDVKATSCQRPGHEERKGMLPSHVGEGARKKAHNGLVEEGRWDLTRINKKGGA